MRQFRPAAMLGITSHDSDQDHPSCGDRRNSKKSYHITLYTDLRTLPALYSKVRHYLDWAVTLTCHLARGRVK